MWVFKKHFLKTLMFLSQKLFFLHFSSMSGQEYILSSASEADSDTSHYVKKNSKRTGKTIISYLSLSSSPPNLRRGGEADQSKKKRWGAKAKSDKTSSRKGILCLVYIWRWRRLKTEWWNSWGARASTTWPHSQEKRIVLLTF